MGLSVGIVGLPNVGKSTLFNALTKKQQAAAENYPFCTIEPNSAIVEVADPRLDKLAEMAKSEQIIRATVEFTDIAGLVKGASKGEGSLQVTTSLFSISVSLFFFCCSLLTSLLYFF